MQQMMELLSHGELGLLSLLLSNRHEYGDIGLALADRVYVRALGSRHLRIIGARAKQAQGRCMLCAIRPDSAQCWGTHWPYNYLREVRQARRHSRGGGGGWPSDRLGGWRGDWNLYDRSSWALVKIWELTWSFPAMEGERKVNGKENKK